MIFFSRTILALEELLTVLGAPGRSGLAGERFIQQLTILAHQSSSHDFRTFQNITSCSAGFF